MIKGKSGKQGLWFWFIGAVVLYLIVPGFKGTVDNLFAGIGTPTPSGAGAGIGTETGTGTGVGLIECIYDGTTLTLGPMEKKFAPTTSVAGEYIRLLKNGKDEGLKVDGSTNAANYKDAITLFYAENSSTYYAAKHEFKVPCTSAISSADVNLDPNGLAKLYELDASAGLNLKLYNDDNGNLNYGAGGLIADNESIAVGDVVTISGSLQGSYQDAFSPYGNMLVTVRWNSTAYDKIDFTVNTEGYTAVSGAETPTFRSTANAATGFKLSTWKVPGIISNKKLDFSLVLDAGDDTGDEPSTNGGDINFTIDDEDWYKDSTTGEMNFGPEDNSDVDAGFAGAKGRHLVVE